MMASGQVKLLGNASYYAGFEAPLTMSVDQIWKLPAQDGGAGDIFKTDGANNTYWGAADIAGSTVIGDLKYSMLSQAQMDSQVGSNIWQLCNGAGVSGSAYHTLTGRSAVPNLVTDNRFLRAAGGSLAVGGIQTDTTAKNGLSNAISSVYSVTGISGTADLARAVFKNANYEVSEGTHYHVSPAFADGSMASGVYGASIDTNGTRGKWNGSTVSSNGNNTSDDKYTSGATFNTNLLDSTSYQDAHTHSFTQSGTGSGTAAAQTISGDGETRPNNMAANVFIRIN